jgi:hypothetical protein
MTEITISIVCESIAGYDKCCRVHSVTNTQSSWLLAEVHQTWRAQSEVIAFIAILSTLVVELVYGC